MPSRKKFDAVATIGEYTDRNGDKKKRYSTIGTVFEDENGRLSLKLDTIPIGPNWSGYVNFYEPRDPRPADDGRPAASQAQHRANNYERAAHGGRAPQPSADAYDDGDEIPF